MSAHVTELLALAAAGALEAGEPVVSPMVQLELTFLHEIGRLSVTGADIIGEQKTVSLIDVTELAPVYDVSGTTSRLAVCTVLRLMAAMARARGELVNPSLRRSDLTAAE